MQLDPNYPNLIMLKKIAKTIDEMAKNEELMAGIMAAAEDDMGGGEDEYNQNDYEDDDAINQSSQQKDRLKTIGEEEDKLYESKKTGDKKSTGG